jgi:hypothetical protein
MHAVEIAEGYGRATRLWGNRVVRADDSYAHAGRDASLAARVKRSAPAGTSGRLKAMTPYPGSARGESA